MLPARAVSLVVIMLYIPMYECDRCGKDWPATWEYWRLVSGEQICVSCYKKQLALEDRSVSDNRTKKS